MNNTQIYIENIGVGLADINNLHNLNLNTNEYLVVGQRNNFSHISALDNEYNLVVNNNGVGINATRQEMKDTKSVKTKNGRSAMKGKCCKCDTNMYAMLPNDKSSSIKPKSMKSKKK